MSSTEPSAPFPEEGGDGDGGCPELPTCEAVQDAAPTLISISKISSPSASVNQGRSPPKLFFPTESVCDSPSHDHDMGGPMDDSDSEDDEETNYNRSAEAVFNRVTLGILAVSLLWLSSLSTAGTWCPLDRAMSSLPHLSAPVKPVFPCARLNLCFNT